MTCVLFGHRTASERIRGRVEAMVIELIEKHGVTFFYIGNHGGFDALALKVLRDCVKRYPQVDYCVVLAYFPRNETDAGDMMKTLYPTGLETVPRRFAITYRNRWMIDASDCVAVYLVRHSGGAYDAMRYAERRGKTVLKL